MKTMTKLEREFCAEGVLDRPRYFPRQLITPAELTLEQNYFRDKMRRHNRMMHGWGVVCGAQVGPVLNSDKTDTEPWKVAVCPGYILGPFGDEIVIDRHRTIDLRTEGLISVCGEPAGEAVDPWCSDVYIRRQMENGETTLFVAIKYKEILTRPVRVQPTSCGCSDAQCEYSRLCDGYEIGVLDECPESHVNPPNIVGGSVDLETLAKGALPVCPDCPTCPWVVLARVRINSDGVIEEIDNFSCRRIVISFGNFWWRGTGNGVVIRTVAPEELNQGDSNRTITITGTNLISDPLPNVSLGSGVTVKEVDKTPDGKLIVKVDVATNATIDRRDLRIIKPDCSTAEWKIEIKGINTGSKFIRLPASEPALQPRPETEPQLQSATKEPSKKAGRKGRKH